MTTIFRIAAIPVQNPSHQKTPLFSGKQPQKSESFFVPTQTPVHVEGPTEIENFLWGFRILCKKSLLNFTADQTVTRDQKIWPISESCQFCVQIHPPKSTVFSAIYPPKWILFLVSQKPHPCTPINKKIFRRFFDMWERRLSISKFQLIRLEISPISIFNFSRYHSRTQIVTF